MTTYPGFIRGSLAAEEKSRFIKGDLLRHIGIFEAEQLDYITQRYQATARERDRPTFEKCFLTKMPFALGETIYPDSFPIGDGVQIVKRTIEIGESFKAFADSEAFLERATEGMLILFGSSAASIIKKAIEGTDEHTLADLLISIGLAEPKHVDDDVRRILEEKAADGSTSTVVDAASNALQMLAISHSTEAASQHS